jgi:putative Holliday junction resolvase
VLAIDVGRRRVGLAISDPTCTLARPLATITLASADTAAAADRIAAEIQRLCAEEGGIGTIVVGLPTRLDGSASEQTAYVQTLVAELRNRTRVPVTTEDERLTSREAEARLAVNERDWRKRKPRLDAAAAAVFLQDYLDRARNAS